MENVTNNPSHSISLLVNNRPGVLIRISLVFARRGYNIDSLVVSPAHDESFSRMSITANSRTKRSGKLEKQKAVSSANRRTKHSRFTMNCSTR